MRTLEKIKQIQQTMSKPPAPPPEPKPSTEALLEEEKDPLNVSKSIIIPFSIEQCGSLQLITDFLVNRIRSVDELEKMKSNSSGIIEFQPQIGMGMGGAAGGGGVVGGAIPTYAMNPADLLDELADRVLTLPSHFPQVEKDDIMAEI